MLLVFLCIYLTQNVLRSWDLEGEIERTIWNHFKPDQLLVINMTLALIILLYDDIGSNYKVCTQAKMVWALDKTNGSTLFQISAHNDVITGIYILCL